MTSDHPQETPPRARLTELLVRWKQAVLDQWERFQEDDRLVDETSGTEKSIMRNREFSDAHFLVVAMRLILRLDVLVTEALGLEETEELSLLRSDMGIVYKFRNFGEHIDDHVLLRGRDKFEELGGHGLHITDKPSSAVYMVRGEDLVLGPAVASAVALADYLLPRVNPR
jgi:hypothetical protein